MYYYKDHHLYQYYAKYGNQLFKTKEEYLQWARGNGYQLNNISYFRLSKWAKKTDEYPEGAWVEYEVVPGTILYDERDFSKYEFASEEDIVVTPIAPQGCKKSGLSKKRDRSFIFKITVTFLSWPHKAKILNNLKF